VIEHFFEGYRQIMGEMGRVLRRGGYLFLTFPQMSFLRKASAFLGRYPKLPSDALDVNSKDFYQFALDAQVVLQDSLKAGFQILARTSYGGLKGLKDEAGPLKSPLQRLYDSPGTAARVIRVLAKLLLGRWCGHMALLVLRKA
jgi:hypothetical protein